MKLATLKNDRPDGQLVVVSRDLTRFVSAGRIASTLQSALDNWEELLPRLSDLSAQLDNNEIAGLEFDPSQAMAPLPRAYQWIDCAAYLSHLERVRSLKGSRGEQFQSRKPFMYQGGSDSLIASTDAICVPAEDLAIDFEAELAAILGPVPMGVLKDEAARAIRLLTVCNDVSLRSLVVEDLNDGFGFFHSKPATSFAPIVATPDEFGDAWRDNRLHVKVRITLNDDLFGEVDAGADMHFDFADLIVAATQTRQLGAGTIIGAGTIANRHSETAPVKKDEAGFACIAEARTDERARLGKARTPFLKNADRVRIQALDSKGQAVFGEIDQNVQIVG